MICGILAQNCKGSIMLLKLRKCVARPLPLLPAATILRAGAISDNGLASTVRGSKLAYRVLVVEDTEDIRAMLKLVLQTYGYEVIEATDGVEAVERAKSEHPDAIIIDMSLPRLDGYKTTKLIRQDPALKGIPVIACTAYNRWEWHSKSIAAGCDAFITKPIDFDRLHLVLSGLLARRKAS